MPLKKYNPTTPAQRGLVLIDRSELFKGRPVKKLTEGFSKSGGRTNGLFFSTRNSSALFFFFKVLSISILFLFLKKVQYLESSAIFHLSHLY